MDKIGWVAGVALFLIIMWALVSLEESRRTDCEGMGGIYVMNTRGSDICYVDGKMVKAY